MRAITSGGWLMALLLACAAVANDPDSTPDSVSTDVPAAPAVEPAGGDEPASPVPEAAPAETPSETAPPVDPPPPEPVASRVRIELDVRGELFAPTGRDTDPVRQPITVEARFDFLEQPAIAGEATASRLYSEAKSLVSVNEQSHEMTLPADARRVEVALRGTTPAPYLADGFLSREESDLLDTPFDSLLLDRLLPTEPVAAGAKWTVPADATAGMLAIDTIESGSLDAELTAVEDDLATVRLTGIIDGAVDGVPTHLAIEGECSVATTAVDGDTAAWRLTAARVAAVTIRERRQASHVAPGFDVEARVAVARRPVAAGAAQEPVAATAAAPSDRRRGAGRPGLVWHQNRDGGYDLVCDDRWRVVEDGPTGLVLRLVDRGALVGQCSLTVLPRSDALAPPTIAEVQRDIERSLTGQFGRFASASEATRSDGVRIVRVVSEGTAENLPFRWIHHVLTDASGRRAAATFMLEASAAKRFAAADREFVDGLAFPAIPTPTPGAPAEREARAPRETVTP
jgi:hypothetical protein